MHATEHGGTQPVGRAMARRIAALAFAFAAGSAAGVDVPYMTGRVVDNAEILSHGARAEIDARIRAHEDKTTNQLAVLSVTSLQGETVEQFATAVFDAWKLGRKDKDNGVLVLVSPAERRLRIEVGYGLEGTLTDVAAGRIIRNVITPRFKDGNYDRGLVEGTNAIVAQLEGTGAAPADSPEPAKAAKSTSDFTIDAPDMPWYQRVLFGAFIFGIIGLFTIIGVMTPGVGWFLYLFLIPFWAMFPIIIVGSKGAFALLATYLIAYPVAKLIVSRRPWYATAAKEMKSKGRATIGGFTVSSGGFSSGGGSSGGGGGGGSSGGGGASGSW